MLAALLFDAYLMVDWSAASTPKTGADSMWVFYKRADWELIENPPTRAAACTRILQLVGRSKGILVGMDFAFGYPVGLASRLGLAGAAYRAIWTELGRSRTLLGLPSGKGLQLAFNQETRPCGARRVSASASGALRERSRPGFCTRSDRWVRKRSLEPRCFGSSVRTSRKMLASGHLRRGSHRPTRVRAKTAQLSSQGRICWAHLTCGDNIRMDQRKVHRFHTHSTSESFLLRSFLC